MEYTAEQLRNSALYTEALIVQTGAEFCTVKCEGHVDQLNAHAAALERIEKLEKHAEAMENHAKAMRLWIGSQARKVDEETTREAGLTLVSLFDAYRAALPKEPR